MRALVVSIWIFINLVFFGMCGYMYLLGSQFWMYMDQQAETPTTSTYDQQIYFYNRGYSKNDTSLKNLNDTKQRIKHTAKENNTITLIKNSKPRFPNLQGKDFELDTKKYICFNNDSENECDRKTLEFKDKILKELRRIFTDESNILKTGLENPYDVHFDGKRENYMEKSPRQIMCELMKVNTRTLTKADLKGRSSYPLRELLPKKDFSNNRVYNSCAIIASAGALKGSNLGAEIDSHDIVLRFNHAPTKGFESDVGSKTTIRVLNSQVVSKKQYKFLESPIFKNVTLIAWDPSNYTASVNDWLEKPEFDLFPNYMEYRKTNARSRFFLVKPSSLWSLWDFLQSNSPSRLRRNPPSSGFLGLGLLLPVCNFVDMFEYVPSTRATKKCHYYDPQDNEACTFGVWHPLAAEKLIAQYLNTANDRNVFQKGYIRIPGFRNAKC